MAKFKVGDRVKVVQSGSGVSDEEMGKVVTISEVGTYCHEPGYKVEPAIGNTKSHWYDGFIGECSFELVAPAELTSLPVELTSLPEKWYILSSPVYRQEFIEILKNNGGSYISFDTERYYYFNGLTYKTHHLTSQPVREGYVNITFDQFKRFVLKQNDAPVLKEQPAAQPSNSQKFKFEIGQEVETTGLGEQTCNPDGVSFTSNNNLRSFKITIKDRKLTTNRGIWYEVYLDGSRYPYGNWISEDGLKAKEFKPSTREAYEAQEQKNNMEAYGGNEAKFKVGDWVVVTERHLDNKAVVGLITRLLTIQEYSNIPYQVEIRGDQADKYSWCKNVRHATPEERRKAESVNGKVVLGKVAIDTETSFLKPWYDVEQDKAFKEFMTNPSYVRSKPRQIGGATSDMTVALGYSMMFPEYFKKSSNNIEIKRNLTNPVYVKSHEEFKIKINKPKTIKL